MDNFLGMGMRRRLGSCLFIGTLVLDAGGAQAASDSAGKDIAIAMPIAAGGIALLHDWDWKGVEQLTFDVGTTVGTALLLKQVVHEERPDHSDSQSFPSDTAALAFAPAAFLWDRYGWQYGAPAYAAAAYVGWSRVDAKEHHWWDVVTSAGIAWSYSHFITHRWHNSALESDVYATPEGAYARLSYRW